MSRRRAAKDVHGMPSARPKDDGEPYTIVLGLKPRKGGTSPVRATNETGNDAAAGDRVSTFEIPPVQIDPDRIPPPLLTSEPGSFAHETLKTRVPHIVHDTIALNAFPSEIRTALEDLHAELTAGRIRSLREAAPDAALWNALSRPYLGRTWLDVPWLWAEA